MKAAYPDKVFFNGFDEQLIGAFAMGADAAIGTTVNVFAPLFVQASRLFRGGEIARAFAVQREINYCVEEMCKVGIFSAVKYILSKQGIEMGDCRRPFHALSPQECAGNFAPRIRSVCENALAREAFLGGGSSLPDGCPEFSGTQYNAQDKRRSALLKRRFSFYDGD